MQTPIQSLHLLQLSEHHTFLHILDNSVEAIRLSQPKSSISSESHLKGFINHWYIIILIAAKVEGVEDVES